MEAFNAMIKSWQEIFAAIKGVPMKLKETRMKVAANSKI